MKERLLKATIAAFVLGAAVVAVWAFARLRDGPAEQAPVVESRLEHQPRSTPTPAPPSGQRTRGHRPLTASRTIGPPQVVPPSKSVFTTDGEPARPAPIYKPAGRPEEMAVRRILEPFVTRRPNADMPFVRCLDPGGWKQAYGEDEQDADPLAVRSRDPDQAECRARVRARDRATVFEILKDASGAYRGHLAASDVHERMDGYMGRWFESDVQVDTEEPYPVPEP